MSSAVGPAESRWKIAKMTRLLIHVEGETKESFVNELLGPNLHDRGYSVVAARLVGNARLRSRRGGIRSWPTVREEILNRLNEDSGSIASTMVDYYALPQGPRDAWPGRRAATGRAFERRACTVEDALLQDVTREMGASFNSNRFVPYVMMHEFEAMLFSDCDGFARGIGRSDLAPKFQEIRDAFGTPEEIDDSPDTAPSKRVEALVPGYQKPLMGTLAALEIGLDAIRAACPHFRNWLDRLERLLTQAG